MDFDEQIGRALLTCNQELRHVVESALAEGEFDSVLRATSLLKGLAELEKSRIANAPRLASPPVSVLPREVTPASPTDGSSRHPAKAPTKSKTGYPRFRRDGEYLVKVGWSKKSRQEYEHRADFKVVRAVAEDLEDRLSGGRAVSVDELLPLVAGEDGEHIPSYQLYLVIAWLRSECLLNRIGRKGYTGATPNGLVAQAEQHWKTLAV